MLKIVCIETFPESSESIPCSSGVEVSQLLSAEQFFPVVLHENNKTPNPKNKILEIVWI